MPDGPVEREGGFRGACLVRPKEKPGDKSRPWDSWGGIRGQKGVGIEQMIRETMNKSTGDRKRTEVKVNQTIPSQRQVSEGGFRGASHRKKFRIETRADQGL